MNFLGNILKEKKDYVEQRKKILPQTELLNRFKRPLRESQFKSILEKTGTHLIAEIKRASPSKGLIRSDLDAVQIANIYEQEGLELVSILTEEEFFKGSMDDLAKVREKTNLSILCKDFIIDSYQIYEAKLYGADAVLLITAILNDGQLKEFIGILKKLKMDAIVEIHNEEQLERALNFNEDLEIIGINHRNLEDFSIDLEITERLLPKIPKDKIVIAESGIETATQIRKFRELGVNGVLIGESLMREKDIRGKLNEFVRALSE